MSLKDVNGIQRLTAVNDGRSHSLVLTGKGQRSLEQLKRLGREHEARVTRLLGHERRRELLNRLRDFG
jgi:DNA-binding MarR family transcriptional regulator